MLKSTLRIPKKQKEVSLPYPVLKEAIGKSGCIVLFLGPDEGVVVSQGEKWRKDKVNLVGEYSKDWDESGFKPTTTRITLENIGETVG